MEHYDRVWANVDLDMIRSNVEHMKNNIQKETKIIGVIKADGYGHGAVPIAKELEPIPYMFGFAVATAEEAFILRKSGIQKPILILGYTFPYSYEMLAKEEIRPTVFRLDMAEEISLAASKVNKKCKVHIKVDTGMSRIGIMPNEAGIDFVKHIMCLPGIEIEGIFTHFSKSDVTDKTCAKEQLTKLLDFVKRIERELGLIIPIKHASNSAGILELREANLDVVRAGITLYGLDPSNEIDKTKIGIKPALSLKSHIVYIKELEKGTAIGYGGTYVTERKTKVATIPVGYGDGYPRGLTNSGYILLHGQKAPILGRICMDQFMVDVTDMKEAKNGDEVTLIGKDGDKEITMETVSELSGRFHYELTCDLGKRIPRVYWKNGRIVGSKDYFKDYE